jgi:peroxiredoxin
MNRQLICLFLLVFSFQAFALSPGQSVQNFSLPSLSENVKTIDFAQYKGLVVYVDFWASWCTPCAKAFPELNKIYDELQPYGFEIIAISTDENQKDAYQFLKKYPAKFLLAHDKEGVVAEQFNLPGMPAGYLIDSTGKVKKVVLGLQKPSDADNLIKEIKKELGI